MSRVIKICGLRDPQNIREIIQLKPDWIGLIFHPGSPRYISDPANLTFLNNLAKRPLTVGVFVNPHLGEIFRVTKILNINIIQLHGSETPDFCQELREYGFMVMKTFGIHNDFNFRHTDPYQNKVDYFLFDTRSPKLGGTGEKFDWDLLKEYRGETSFLLSGGISADTQCIPKHRQLLGVDLNSRFETAPGIKDIGLLQKFFKQFRNE